jgi:hypothetical protein
MAHVSHAVMEIASIVIEVILVPAQEGRFSEGIGEFWTFNWIITANLLQLREIGVYHTATAA